jgi:PAS domain S-box-containing protein
MSILRPAKSSYLPHLPVLLLISWTLLIVISALWNVGNLKDQAVNLAKAEARSNWEKDQSFRLWATRHGGLYVTPDERTPPNPYLSHLPNRDVKTTEGQLLTLMNPAYMMRQMTEEFEETFNVKGKITAQVLLNPANEPDAWELMALRKFENGVEEVAEVSTIQGAPYVRLMRPMYMAEGCVKCHGHLGFKEGDLRGGVSVSVPLTKYLATEQNSKNVLFATHGGIWAVGFLVIGFISWRGKLRHDFQKEAEEALLDSEERYKTLFENSEVSIWHEDLSDVCDALEKLREDGIEDLRSYLEENVDVAWNLARQVKVVHVNRATLRLFGASAEDEFINQIDNTFGQNAIKVLIDEMSAIWENQKFFRSEVSFIRQDGDPLEAILSFRIPQTREGFKSVPITIIDITESKLAEATLQKSEERFRALYHQSPMGISLEDYSEVKLMIDRLVDNGVTDFRSYFHGHPEKLSDAIEKIRLIAVNETHLALYDAKTFDEYAAFDSSQMYTVIPDWRQFYIDELSSFAEGETAFSREVQDQRSDGTTFDLNCISQIVKGREKDWAEVITSHADVTERRQFEDHARRAQKMEAVGQLSGGIAHDFNNILGIVMGNLEIIEQLVGDNEKVQGRIATAQRGARRGAELTRKLLGFSAKEAQGTSLTSLNELIRNLDQLLAKSLTVAVTIGHHLADDLWMVDVDPGDLQDAILNISLNARDAMPDGGTLVIETANKHLDQGYVEKNPGSLRGDFVMLALSDSGEGMIAAVKDRVLEPFFTTKSEGRGSGLGLSMVYGFVQRSGGHLKIYSEPGEGTTIRLYLPRAQTLMVDESQPFEAPDMELPGGNETILVVDDEEALADVACINLEDLGYTTIMANNGKQALRILMDNKDIDLLFTDVIMPGDLDGYQLAISAQKNRPTLKALLTSGFTKKKEMIQNADSAKYAELSSTLLSKPYTQAELAFAVRNMLDGET